MRGRTSSRTCNVVVVVGERGFKKAAHLLRRRLHAPRLRRELDVAARLPVVLGLRALPQDADPQVAGVHLAITRSDDDAHISDLRGSIVVARRGPNGPKIEKETTHHLLSRR